MRAGIRSVIGSLGNLCSVIYGRPAGSERLILTIPTGRLSVAINGFAHRLDDKGYFFNLESNGYPKASTMRNSAARR